MENKIITYWQLFTYDVWGNEDDGFEVNDRFAYNGKCELELQVTHNNIFTPQAFLSASPTDKQIKKAFGIRGSCDITTSGDDLNIYINRASDNYPLGEMSCISHESLSPIRKVKNYDQIF